MDQVKFLITIAITDNISIHDIEKSVRDSLEFSEGDSFLNIERIEEKIMA